MTLAKIQWLLAAILPMGLIGYFVSLYQRETPSSAYLPGPSSHGHYQIEMQCALCHTEDGSGGVRQDACLQCHEAELKKANDSHPATKFLDPRNADRLAQLDARYCISCHVEHQPEITHSMGVSLPPDYCYFCHQDIATDRPSHAGMGFETCATAGCHNFHDNSGLYEDFLEKHTGEPPFLAHPVNPSRNRYQGWAETNGTRSLTASDRDAPNDVPYSQDTVYDWATSAHAQSGVNCAGCHQADTTKTWIPRPGIESCQSCHKAESQSFQEGRHGMRLAQGLSPMTPAQARIPMKPESAHRELSCVSCHGDHSFDTRHAAVDACLSCHDDGHTKAYLGSPHNRAWLAELANDDRPNTGVSCATCHLPRAEVSLGGHPAITVQHNQNDNLRPNEKMLRTVCLNCHGLGFAIDALASPTLIQNNFSAPPADHIRSIDMVLDRLRARGAVD